MQLRAPVVIEVQAPLALQLQGPRRDEQAAVVTLPTASDVLTLRVFSERYAERLGKPLSANDQGCLKQLLEHDGLGETPLTEDAVEAFFAKLRTAGKAASTRNKHVQATTRMFRWAVRKGYLARSPIEDSDTIRREKHAQRHRRLAPGEEGALLAAVPRISGGSSSRQSRPGAVVASSSASPGPTSASSAGRSPSAPSAPRRGRTVCCRCLAGCAASW